MTTNTAARKTKLEMVFAEIVKIDSSLRWGGEGIEIASYICGKFPKTSEAVKAAKKPYRIGGRATW